MDIISDMGIGIPKGLKPSDKQRLVDITNEAVANNDSIKTSMVSHVNAKAETSLPNTTTWQTIENTIDGIDTTKDLVIEYGNLQPYYETVQGNVWNYTVEANITHIKVNKLGDMSTYVSDNNNNLYRFDKDGNLKWKINVNYSVKYLECDPSGNLYLTLYTGTCYVSYKYNSSGSKVFTYIDINKNITGTLFAGYDIKHNRAYIISSNKINSVCTSIYYKYDNNNSLISATTLSGTNVSSRMINGSKALILDTEELIVPATGFRSDGSVEQFDRYLIKFDSLGVFSSQNSSADFSYNSIINDNNTIISLSGPVGDGALSICLLDSSLNIIKSISTDSWYIGFVQDFFNVLFDNAVFFNTTNFIIPYSPDAYSNPYPLEGTLHSGSRKYLVMGLTTSELSNIYTFKRIEYGAFDYDGTYLYYAKEGTNQLFKLSFDSNDKSIELGDYTNINDNVNLFSDENKNVYSININNINNSHVTPIIDKFDNQMSKLLSINLLTVSSFNSINRILCIFCKDNIIYNYLIQSDSKAALLKINSITGALISINNINFTSDAMSSGFSRGIYDSNTNSVILLLYNNQYNNYLNMLKVDLNGNIIFNISFTSNSTGQFSLLNIDKYSNIYLSYILGANGTTTSSIKKYDKDGNLLNTFSINDGKPYIAINNDLNDNNIYKSCLDDNNNAISIFNKNGTKLAQKINSIAALNGYSVVKNGMIIFVNRESTNNLYLTSVNNDIPSLGIDTSYSAYDPNFIIDSDNNLYYITASSSLKLHKISLLNTPTYQVFKGYKIVGYK